jgi:pimeloyl-ACP methyl ester carboxylesterase
MTDFAVETDGGRIAGWRAGSGPPALVLHGGPGLSDITEELAAELADRFSTIRYQQRGLAPSTVAGPHTVEQNVADALAVLDGLGIDRAWVIGHSWGGHLAMHVAVAAPQRLLGLVAIDPLGAVPDGGEADLDLNLTAQLSPEETARTHELDERLLAGEGMPEDSEEMFRLVWPYYFATPENAPPMPPVTLSDDAYAGGWTSVREHFERGTLVRGLPRLDLPTLFVVGAESPIPVERSRESAALIPGARLEVLEGCGHMPWMEQPGRIARAVAAVAASA